MLQPIAQGALADAVTRNTPLLSPEDRFSRSSKRRSSLPAPTPTDQQLLEMDPQLR
ncbi:hypothetical protein [Streptomyces mirabilis]|uniref:hypothetical protein n=1 Tax=Streptomyces mirabilis TaxID=68239 RepID=UPI00369AE1EF